VGSFNANVPAHELGAVAMKAALAKANVSADEVDEVILGQVLTAGQGQNPARQAAMKAGFPPDKTAFCINQVCGSGLRAAALAMLHVASGDSNIILAGGQESMSLSPHVAHRWPHYATLVSGHGDSLGTFGVGESSTPPISPLSV
jgi:acetyl-CoA C-acetyltransferase